MKLKGMQTIVLCGHAACGVAYAHSLDALEVLRLIIEGKLRIKRSLSRDGIKVRVFFDVAYPGDRQRTYFVDRRAAENFLREHGHAIRV